MLKDNEAKAESFISRAPWRQYLDKKYPQAKEEVLKANTEASENLDEEELSDGDYKNQFDALMKARSELEESWYLEKTIAILSKRRRQ